MSRIVTAHVEVYVFRRRGTRVEFLGLRRRPDDALPNVWQPVTGTLRRGETAVRAARRELREETGLVARRLWRLERMTVFYDPGADVVQAVPRFAAEVDVRDPVRLSAEHRAYRFLSAREAARRFLWDSQREGLAAVRSDILSGGLRARILEIDGSARRARRSRNP